MKKRTIQFAAWAALVAIVFVTISPIEWRPRDILPVDIDRALAFAAMTALFVAAYPRHWFAHSVLAVMGAGGIELLQQLSPTRHARLDDATVKAAGALAGALFAQAANIIRERKISSRRGPLKSSRQSRPGRHLPALSDGINPVTRLAVDSRLIESIYFGQADGRLRIRFRNGEQRLFEGVPEEEALAMAVAPSPGRYYADRIKPNFKRIAA
ncbi:KTSC domain-containing protein [Rhizobium sp. BK376]|nr:KTSC domain-containing protein [Rhizobium sp. BK376]TCR85789.1 KTSC domain-containing protein [Rhizobium sp. BK376]